MLLLPVGEAFEISKTTLKVIQQQNSSESVNVAVFKKCTDFEAMRKISALKQQLIINFFFFLQNS